MADDNKNHFIKVAAKCEQCSVILYYVIHCIEPVKIYHKLCKGYGVNIASTDMGWKWVKKFLEGCADMHDESCSEYPSVIM